MPVPRTPVPIQKRERRPAAVPAEPQPADDALTPREFLAGMAEHLDDLRHHLLIAVIALGVATIASFWLAEYIMQILARPVGGLSALRAIDVTENLSVFMRVSLLSGFTVSFPIIAWQLIRFIRPGLEPKEARWLNIFIPILTILFLAGVAFAYFVMLPVAVPFMLNFLGIQNDPRPASYFDFVTNLLFWIGIIFETPVVIFVLARLHIVSAAQLAKQWRLAVVVCAILAMLITPTVDPVNMGLLMAPLLALYALSVLFAKFAA